MLPLKGMRVIAVEQYGAGPFGTHVPGRPGRGGDQDRKPGRGGRTSGRSGGTASFWGRGTAISTRAFNRNKRSITLNLKAP